MSTPTHTLSGDALEFAVALALDPTFVGPLTDDDRYTTGWELAGPLLEPHKISVHELLHVGYAESRMPVAQHVGWKAQAHYLVGLCRYRHEATGSTYLEAAMRCLVLLKLGSHVDIPQELCK